MLKRFLRSPSNGFLVALCIALAIGLAAVSLSRESPFNHRQNIGVKQKAEESIESQKNGRDTESSIDAARQSNRNDRSDEASEYWTIFGHRLKITDSLLVIFTFTLWWATRALVVRAEETAELQLRAYVWMDTEATPNIADAFNIRSVIKNSGQTPAHDVHSWAENGLFADPLPEGHSFADAPTSIPGPRFVVNPDSVHFNISRRDEPFRPEEFAAIDDGYLTLYYWGEIRYRDTFGQNRWCKFRYAWLPTGPTRGAWRYCDHGNEAN